MNEKPQDQSFSRWLFPIIKALKSLGGSGKASDVIDKIAEIEKVPDEQRTIVHESGARKFDNQIQWARDRLVRAGYLEKKEQSGWGVWKLTEKGLSCESLSENLIEQISNGAAGSEIEQEDLQENILDLIKEFKAKYFDTKDGEYHRKLLREGKETGRKNWEAARSLFSQGKDIENAVLYKLLPHVNTQNNRASGNWIHVAPSITKDIKEWFEGAGWVAVGEWHEVATSIFSFLQNAVEKPEHFRDFCDKFDSDFPHKGFQVGMLSPILSVLSPEHYLVVNAKPIAVINWLTGSKFKARIKDMPDIIRAIRSWVDENHQIFEPFSASGISVYEAFDMFCHWLKTVKKYPLKVVSESSGSGLYERLGRGNAESARKTFEKIFVDKQNQEAAEAFLSECIQRAHSKNPNNWEITLGPRSIKLNVGFYRILRFHFREIKLYLLGSAFGSELREKYADMADFSEPIFRSIKEEVGQCTFSPSLLSKHLPDMKYSILSFIDLAASTSKSTVWASSHSPGVIEYLREKTNQELPSPDYETEIREQLETSEDEDDLASDEIDTDSAMKVAEVREPEPAHNGRYTVVDCAHETFMDEGRLERWAKSISRKHQAVLYGPPGTGKTFLAERLAKIIASEGDGLIETIQFHPAYTYEEFVEGFRPIQNANGLPSYHLKPGRFVDFCRTAAERTGNSVLIIDEINRANIPRVFGELMNLLEYREKRMLLASGTAFKIPDNVHIIATMNTADRSIALVDFALRRRFAFFQLEPDYTVMGRFLDNKGFNSSGLISVLKEINTKINDRNYAIGVSYFLHDNLQERLEDIWSMEIEPYLEEYFFSQPETMSEFKWTSIHNRVLP